MILCCPSFNRWRSATTQILYTMTSKHNIGKYSISYTVMYRNVPFFVYFYSFHIFSSLYLKIIENYMIRRQ